MAERSVSFRHWPRCVGFVRLAQEPETFGLVNWDVAGKPSGETLKRPGVFCLIDQINWTPVSVTFRHTIRHWRNEYPPSNVRTNFSGKSTVPGRQMRAPEFVRFRTTQSMIEDFPRTIFTPLSTRDRALPRRSLLRRSSMTYLRTMKNTFAPAKTVRNREAATSKCSCRTAPKPPVNNLNASRIIQTRK